LPQWRGADPITFSILSGQKKTGVSLMLIEQSLDTGKLLAQRSLPIQATETAPSLTVKLIKLSNSMLVKYIPLYQSGVIRPKHQPHPDRATYSRKLKKHDGLIDQKKSALEIEREIRAYIDWPGSQTQLLDRLVIITKAHVSSIPKTTLDILCGDGAYLSIDELIAPSGRRMNVSSYINGYAAA
jgi:methionyl-tRNA formyltransferase